MSFNYHLLSHYQVSPLLIARNKGKSSSDTSFDLGLTSTQVIITQSGIDSPNGISLTWKQLEKINKQKNHCFIIDQNEIEPIVLESPTTGWIRTLFPTTKAPTTLVSGILMHRVKNTDPLKDTKVKLNTLGQLNASRFLDTATGLGYTAILASQKGAQVTSVELDPTAIDLARLNPYSTEIFNNPQIIQKIGDIREIVSAFKPGNFTHILHDPPTFKLAGELYSGDFYRQLFNLLQTKGKLFHYIADPQSKHGHEITPGIINRLYQAGFKSVLPKPQAFGVLATK